VEKLGGSMKSFYSECSRAGHDAPAIAADKAARRRLRALSHSGTGADATSAATWQFMGHSSGYTATPGRPLFGIVPPVFAVPQGSALTIIR